MDSGFTLYSEPPMFNSNGRYIFFKQQKSVEVYNPSENAVKVDIWSYQDVDLQSEQLRHPNKPIILTAVINLKKQPDILFRKKKMKALLLSHLRQQVIL